MLSLARSFSPGVGAHIDASISGYYIDLRLKATDPEWPPVWLEGPGDQIWVAVAQLGLGHYERYLNGDGEEWLAAAVRVADYLVAEQQQEGLTAGGWPHTFALKHSYRVLAPWLSAMAQGEAASLLVRIWRESRDDRYAEAALLALAPMRVPVEEGGVRGELEGGFYPEEYPSRPGSFVLNGCLFSLWGCYDVAISLGDADAQELFDQGVQTLIENLHRYDLGHWSRYDLFPHPVVNIASSSYHHLHIDQLKAMTVICPQPEFRWYARRFEQYEDRRLDAGLAFSRKALFRLVVPRNRLFAHRLPWSQRHPSRLQGHPS